MEYEFTPHGDLDDYRDRWIPEDEDLSEEEARSRMQQDQDYFEEQYRRLEEVLEAALSDLGTAQNIYHVSGQNIGWQGRTGSRILHLTNGEALIDKITPTGGNWSMSVSTSGDLVSATVSHHDSPSGEPYTITPVDPVVAEAYHNEGESAAFDAL